MAESSEEDEIFEFDWTTVDALTFSEQPRASSPDPLNLSLLSDAVDEVQPPPYPEPLRSYSGSHDFVVAFIPEGNTNFSRPDGIIDVNMDSILQLECNWNNENNIALFVRAMLVYKDQPDVVVKPCSAHKLEDPDSCKHILHSGDASQKVLYCGGDSSYDRYSLLMTVPESGPCLLKYKFTCGTDCLTVDKRQRLALVLMLENSKACGQQVFDIRINSDPTRDRKIKFAGIKRVANSSGYIPAKIKKHGPNAEIEPNTGFSVGILCNRWKTDDLNIIQNTIFNLKELLETKQKILLDNAKDNSPIPTFVAELKIIKFVGMVLQCADEFTKNWLTDTVQKFPPNHNCDGFKIIPGDEMPKRLVMGQIMVRQPMLNVEDIKTKLKQLNRWIDIERWIFVANEQKEIIVYMSDTDIFQLEKRNYQLSYGIGVVNVAIDTERDVLTPMSVGSPGFVDVNTEDFRRYRTCSIRTFSTIPSSISSRNSFMPLL